MKHRTPMLHTLTFPKHRLLLHILHDITVTTNFVYTE